MGRNTEYQTARDYQIERHDEGKEKKVKLESTHSIITPCSYYAIIHEPENFSVCKLIEYANVKQNKWDKEFTKMQVTSVSNLNILKRMILY